MYNSNDLFAVVNMMIAMEILVANIAYFYLEEKSSGDLFLTATSYTRKDIVISKYLFLMLLGLSQLLTAYFVTCINFAVSMLSATNVYNFILNLLFLNIAIAFMTPFGFFKLSAFFKTMLACIIFLVIDCLSMETSFNCYIHNISLEKLVFISILLSIVTICGLMFISNKVFKSRDF